MRRWDHAHYIDNLFIALPKIIYLYKYNSILRCIMESVGHFSVTSDQGMITTSISRHNQS